MAGSAPRLLWESLTPWAARLIKS